MEDIKAPTLDIEGMDDVRLLAVVDTAETLLNAWDIHILGSAAHIEDWLFGDVYAECDRRGLRIDGKWYDAR